MQTSFFLPIILDQKGKTQIQSYAKYTLVIISKHVYADKKSVTGIILRVWRGAKYFYGNVHC